MNHYFDYLSNRSNWLECGDSLIFVQHWRHEWFADEYPVSILDAMRVATDAMRRDEMRFMADFYPGRWKIVIPTQQWDEAQELLSNLRWNHDPGSRLTVAQLSDFGWKYDPAKPEYFAKDASYVKNAEHIAEDLSDWTEFNVEFVDTSSDKGYWRVCLLSEEERAKFARSLQQYEKARRKIEQVMTKDLLILTPEQYQRAKNVIDEVGEKVRERDNLVLISLSSAYTREIVAVLDAVGL